MYYIAPLVANLPISKKTSVSE